MHQPRPTIYDDTALERVRRQLRLEPRQLRRFRYALLQRGRAVDDALAEISADQRDAFRQELDVQPLQLEATFPSTDGSLRLVFRTHSGQAVDAVILQSPSGQRRSLCVSSQVGCAANCSFCATAQLPSVRNLTVAEILDQVAQANRLLGSRGERLQNLVFMGMGEPFHNEENVSRAAELLFSNHHFNMSAKRTVVSTVGIPDAMRRWARRFPRAPLALSLHSARQAVRESLIPLARKYPLTELRAALADVTTLQEGPAMVEYLMLEGVNNSPEDAAALAEFVSGLWIVINLIPLNPVDHAPALKAPTLTACHEFAGWLRDRGCTVTLRRSQGRDVDAACGQLLLKNVAAR